MKIYFRLGWIKNGKVNARSFKSAAAFELFSDYFKRIEKFSPCEVLGFELTGFSKGSASKIWVCHRDEKLKAPSSEEIAALLEKTLNSGIRELQIVIGGPNGFSKADMESLTPDLLWSFGSLTLPHELATVVASEQIYRAFSILNRLPYHLGH